MKVFNQFFNGQNVSVPQTVNSVNNASQTTPETTETPAASDDAITPEVTETPIAGSPKNSTVKVQSWGSEAQNGEEYANDCLSRIIANQYGDFATDENMQQIYDAIQDLNSQIVDPNLIYDGDELKMPEFELDENGNIKSSSEVKETGEAGETGETGEAGETGETGEAGENTVSSVPGEMYIDKDAYNNAVNSGNEDEAKSILLGGAEKYAQDMIKGYDSDADGAISSGEYSSTETKAYMDAYGSDGITELPEILQSNFDVLDLNADGKIDLQEQMAQVLFVDETCDEGLNGKISDDAGIDFEKADEVKERLNLFYDYITGDN